MLLRDQAGDKAGTLPLRRAVSALGSRSPQAPARAPREKPHSAGAGLPAPPSHGMRGAALSTRPWGHKATQAATVPGQGRARGSGLRGRLPWSTLHRLCPPARPQNAARRAEAASRGNRCGENGLLFRQSSKNPSALKAALCKSPHNKQGQAHSSTSLTATPSCCACSCEQGLPLRHTGGLCEGHQRL